MAKTIEIKGLKELETVLKLLPDKPAKKAMNAGLRAGSKVILDEAVRLAPIWSGETKIVMSRGKKRIVFPGMLKKSIIISKGGISEKGVLFKIKITRLAFYSHMLEFGTSKMAAQPFMRPALDNKGEEAIAKILKISGRAIEREATLLGKAHGIL